MPAWRTSSCATCFPKPAHVERADNTPLRSTLTFDGSGDVPVHSSIVLDTVGNVLPPQKADELFRFTETSAPIVGVGARGLFVGVIGGQLSVEGVVYKSPVAGIPGSIDMNFSGQVCYG